MIDAPFNQVEPPTANEVNRLRTERFENRRAINARVGFQSFPLTRDVLQSAEVTVTKSDSKSVAYEFRTKAAQSGGLETNGRRERISGLSRPVAVRRFVREAHG